MDPFCKILRHTVDRQESRNDHPSQPDLYNTLPWNEKYRPTRLTDIHGQSSIVALFQRMMQHNKPMHLLFYGPPGTGKTSSIMSFCKEVYASQPFDQCVMCINASYERGIDMVRSKIKMFCKKSMTPFVYNGSTITYKFIILDEADTLTQDAQNALRRCIEMFSYNTRFCFLCNYISNVISPIMSRCLTHQFKRLPLESVSACLHNICDREGVCVSDASACFSSIYRACRGDMRASVTVLEQMCAIYGKTLDIEQISCHFQITQHSENFWKTWQTSDPLMLPEYVLQLEQSGVSCRMLIRQIIAWLLECKISKSQAVPDDIYSLCIDLSSMEKQLLHVTSTSSVLCLLVSWYTRVR